MLARERLSPLEKKSLYKEAFSDLKKTTTKCSVSQ